MGVRLLLFGHWVKCVKWFMNERVDGWTKELKDEREKGGMKGEVKGRKVERMKGGREA